MSQSQISATHIDDNSRAFLRTKGIKIGRYIGGGNFGQVYAATYIRTGRDCAVKVIDLTKLSPNARGKLLPRELVVMTEVAHPKCIQLYDIFRMNQKVFIFMELARGGQLLDYLVDSDGLEEYEVRELFFELALAVMYLHQKNIAHRDIKLDNILLDEDHHVKLADYGLAIFDSSITRTRCGAQAFSSPELLSGRGYDPFKLDVWQMGVVLYVMLYGNYPFDMQDIKKQYKQQCDPAFIPANLPNTYSEQVRNLVKCMLDPNARTRISVAQILQSDWFKMETEE